MNIAMKNNETRVLPPMRPIKPAVWPRCIDLSFYYFIGIADAPTLGGISGRHSFFLAR